MPTNRLSAELAPSPAARRHAGLLVAVAGLALLAAIAPIAGGILGALVLAVLLDSPYRKLSAIFGQNGAAAVLLALSVVLVFVPALVVGDLAWLQLRSLDLSALQNARWPDSLLGTSLLSGELGDAVKQLAARAMAAAAAVATWAMGSAAHGAADLAVTFLCLFFVLRSGDTLWLRVRGYLPFSPESSDLLRGDLRRVTQATVLGTALSAILQGASMAIGFQLAGLPGPIFWGVVTAFASVLPVVGSAIVWVPAVVLLAVHRQTGPALIMVAFGWLLPSAIDKVARAKVSRRLGDVHPLTTLLGALIGIRLFGVIGLVVGPLIIAVFLELLNLYERDYGTPQGRAQDGSAAAPLAIDLRTP